MKAAALDFELTAAHKGMLALTALGTVALVVVIATYFPHAVDWEVVFRPAALELLALRNPYDVQGFYHPTWTLLPMLPIAWLPANVGRAILFLISAAGFGFSAYRLGAKPPTLAAFIASPPVIHCLLNGNLDWMPLLGFVLPPRLGLFLVAVKPQVGSVVALLWLVEAFRKGGVREVFRVFWPATLGLLISFVLFGLWPLKYGRTLDMWWNASLWPMSIPVGLVLAVAAIRKGEIRYAMAASPCLSPYVLFHSWAGALAAVIASPLEMLAAVIGLWILVLLRAGQVL